MTAIEHLQAAKSILETKRDDAHKNRVVRIRRLDGHD